LDDKIRWDSMMRILHVEDLDQRESILRTAVKGGLSTRAVRKLIAEKTTYRRPRGGRPPAGPEKHPNRALRNLLAFTIEWPVVCGAWLDKDDRILKNAARFKSGQMTDDYLEDLARVVVNLKKMTTSTKKLATQLASLLGELQDKEGGSKT
jgi:hypothetical protein